MASVKDYVYQIKGNKLSLLQKDFTTSDGLNYTYDSDDGLGISSGSTVLKSPIESITDGLEIEYAYSPIYSSGGDTAGQSLMGGKFYVMGWTVAIRPDPATGKSKGYLAFFRRSDNSIHDWQAGYTNDLSDDEYFIVRGSSRWNGLHKVQGYTVAADFGMLITYTPVDSELYPSWGNSNFATSAGGNINYHTDNYIHDRSGGDAHFLGDYFSAGDYLYTAGASADKNSGLFRVSGVTQSSTAGGVDSKVHVDRRYVIATSDDADTASTGLNNEHSDAAAMVTETDETDIIVFKAERDFCYILSDVNVLNDEADIIDLPSYLSKALVYYVKAKVAEDQMEIEAKEYMMREFKRMVEKQASSNVTGPRTVVAGRNSIR